MDGVVTRPSPVCRGWCGLSWPAERRTVITMVPAQTQEHYPAPPPSTQHNTGWVDSQSWRILRYPHDFHLIHHFPRYNSELREVLEPLFRETSIIQPDSRLQTAVPSPVSCCTGGWRGEGLRPAPRYVHLRGRDESSRPIICTGSGTELTDVIMRQPD